MPRPAAKEGEKHKNTAQHMLYISWMVILGDHGIKKKVSKTSIVGLPWVKNFISRLCTNPLGGLPPPLPRPAAKEGEKHKNTA